MANQHVVTHSKSGWAVRRAGSDKVTSTHTTQANAITAARRTAINQKSEVVIHRPDGRIRDKDSYGADSCPPKDRRF